MTPKNRRRMLRATHLTAAAPLLAFIYGPAEVGAALDLAVKWLIVPVVGTSGIAMWQLPKLLKWRSRAVAVKVGP